MKALSVCATYGRLPYLGRMLSSFIHQTYDDKHLVILNDDINVELCCNRKDVTILNFNRKVRLSEKRNIGACLGFYDIIFPWDDDDIYLPRRIANHVKKYKDPKVRAYRNLASYTIYGDKFFKSHGSINSKSYLRDEWFNVRGYHKATEIGSGEDLDLYQRLEGLLVEDIEEDRDFVYNFGGVNYHLSGISDSAGMKDIEKLAHKQLTDMNMVGKKFWINPDFEQYNNFLLLDSIWKNKKDWDDDKMELYINHIGDAKIDISSLL